MYEHLHVPVSHTQHSSIKTTNIKHETNKYTVARLENYFLGCRTTYSRTNKRAIWPSSLNISPRKYVQLAAVTELRKALLSFIQGCIQSSEKG